MKRGNFLNLEKVNIVKIGEYEIKPGANLYRADLAGANLAGANLYRADLYRANLYRADLNGANLRSASLAGASLRSADLTGADLTGANLYCADLRRAIGAFSIGNPGGWHGHAWLRDGKLSIRIGCREFRYAEALAHWQPMQDRLEQLAATEYARQIALARGWAIE